KNSDPSSSNNPGTGTLTIYLTDAPSAEFDSVNIVFSEVSAHIDSQWVTVQGDTVKANLLDLTNGNTIVFGSADVPAGHYTQIRIKIDDAYVVVNGVAEPLDVPSGAQTGLKLGSQFTVDEGSTYELVVDFDVNRSIVITGPPNNPGYKLKPHLRVSTMALSGSVSGTVTNPEHFPVAFAIQNADTVTSTLADTANGFFQLSFLPEGVYRIAIEDTLGQSAVQDSVGVTAGADKNLGQITLQ
ncbi:MAG: DUF4382 domain-containing protein, partial [Leptospiraceae bacterium]|nr:DUF4382 domain-containing protein [Leptospiraceae bacterium]